MNPSGRGAATRVLVVRHGGDQALAAAGPAMAPCHVGPRPGVVDEHQALGVRRIIEATSGNVVDDGAIEQRILADSALLQVKEIAYDPRNATHIALRLQDEAATMVEFRQGFRSMAAPTRELEKLIVSTKLAHGATRSPAGWPPMSPSPRILPAT